MHDSMTGFSHQAAIQGMVWASLHLDVAMKHIKVDTHFRPQWSPDRGGVSNNSNFSSCVISYYQQISTIS
jgi:hypothetical protein